MTETRLGDHRRSRVPTTRALFPSLLDFPSIWVTGLSLLASTLIRRRPTFRPGPPPFPFRPSLSFRRSASERFRRFAAAPIYVPAFGVINAVVRLYPRSLERLRRERLTARNPVTPRRPSNENVLVLSRSLISVRRVAASHDPSYFLLASSPRCPRLRVRFAVLFSLLVVARAFAQRENPFAISIGSNVSRTRNDGTNGRRIAASLARYSTGYREAWSKQLTLAYLRQRPADFSRSKVIYRWLIMSLIGW